MLKRIVIVAGLAAAPLLMPAAHAQNATQNGVLVIYGDDKCPTNEAGEEIVICQRLDEAERFRIPQTLRQPSGPPQQTESWAVRSQGALDAPTNRMGTGSCTTVGAGGGIGCATRNIGRGMAESRARREEQTNLPLP